MQVGPTGIGKLRTFTHPDHARGEEKRRVHIVHAFQTRQGQKSTGEQIDPPRAHFVLGARPGPGVDHIDHQIQLFGQMLEQVGIGPDQLLRVLRVTPQIRRILGITGGNQALTLAGGSTQPWQQSHAKQQHYGFQQTTFEHGNFSAELLMDIHGMRTRLNADCMLAYNRLNNNSR
ncbi:hypothetical protein D3C86_1407160 [compost metagenome]